MLRSLRPACVAFAFLFASCAAFAQVATGTYNYGTFDSLGIDTINVGNLNAHLSIPVLNKTGRGMPFYYNLSYDSSVWYQTTVSGKITWTPVQNFGWRGDTEIATGYLSVNISAVSTQRESYTCYTTTYQNFVYHDPYGILHPFVGSTVLYTGATQCDLPTSHPTLNALATDGSGYTLNVTNYDVGALTSSLGKQFTPPLNVGAGSASVIDSNGNEISVDSSGHFKDTTGNVVLTVGGSAPSSETFQYTDTNGNSQTVTMTYKTYTVQTAFGCSGVGEYGPASASLVNTIEFPDGSTYTFTYEPTPGVSGNVTGRIASIELPQGNSITYTYSGGSNGIECADGSTAGLTRSLGSDSGSAASTWTYTRTTGTGISQTSVVDGLLNHKTYNFVEASNQPAGTTAAYYETSRTINQGTSTTILARNTCYNGAASPCTTSAFTLPIAQIDTYETLNRTTMHGSTVKYNTYGAQTELDTYDYGTSSARGSLLRKELWTYGYSIPVLPTIDQIQDASGNLAGETIFTYDGTTPTSSSGVPQHVAVTGPRGNLTSSKSYASSSTYYPSSATYEDTGSLLTSTTSNGTTTLSYDSTFVYNTGATLPTPSSGVSLAVGASFDTTYTGLPLSSTDPNSQVTHIASYDSLLRPTQINFPDGGKTVYNYESPNQTGIDTYQNSSAYAETEIRYDGYGRPSRLAVANGQSGTPWYQKDTCYDANGNVSFVSYPFSGTGFGMSKACSGSSGDSYTYDVLGRVTQLTRGNGETRTSTYNGRAKKSVDENGVTRISQVDGLGRPTIVCEISSNSTMPQSGSPVNCGTDITGTGFTTTYTYALATGTSTINQGGQTRTFVTDWLGRPTSITEPESGTTTYSYAYNSTGLVVTRQRPKANQTSASTLTTTTTQYDSQGRILSITYSDGTPTKTFAYDSSAGWSDLTQTNLKGRLSIASVSNASTVYSYDPMGRISYLDECLPSGCGTASYNRQQHFTYDWAGNLLSSTDGAGTTSTYTVSPANELLTLTSSIDNSTNPPNIISAMQNGPNGPISYNLGNGLTDVYIYDSLGRSAGAWLCSGSSSPYCAGGSTQLYGFVVSWKGTQTTGDCDTALSTCSYYGFDEFNRLASRTVNNGTVNNFAYIYDRWGNRWQQNVTSGSGPQPQYSFNPANNQISTSGYTYDAAGNMTSDGSHAYTYDAEGNIATVDSGSTATYTYNALNQRVRTTIYGSYITEFLFNQNSQRVSIWNGSTRTVGRGQYYWGTKPVAYYAAEGNAFFQQQDWKSTERMRTAYNGSVYATFTSLPFGDAQTTASGSDGDAYHFAGLDEEIESSTDHAQFRQYNPAQGHWMSPDPYSGSYRWRNPQSFNRYTYALNNPLALIDPLGLDYCYETTNDDGSDTTTCSYDYGGGGDGDDDGGDPGGGGGEGGGAGGGGGAGNSGPGNAPSNYPGHSYSILFCAGDALAANGISLVLDAASIAAGELPGGASAAGLIKAAVTAGVGAVGTGYSTATSPSVAVGAANFGLGFTGTAASTIGVLDQALNGAAALKAIPFLGSAISLFNTGVDVTKTFQAASACVKSGKYD
jgi:RHS repeat-associated protein